MSRTVATTREGQMIDQLTMAATGSDQRGEVEATLGLNPGLAEGLAGTSHLLALGQRVTVDDAVAAAPVIATVKLWD